MTYYAAVPRHAGCTVAWFLFSTCILVLCFASGCSGQAIPSANSPPSEASPVNLRTLITGTCKEFRQYAENVVGTNVIESTLESAVLYLESMLGQENVYTMAMFVEMIIRFLAEGAASGLNVIAVYVTEILRVTGIDVNTPLLCHILLSMAVAFLVSSFPLSFPRFTPEGVASVAQWGLLALIGYWVLTVLLRLLIGIVRRVFWMLKTVMALWLFGLIVSDGSASADATAIRLAGLVLGCVLLGVACSGWEKTVVVENRLSHLEGRLKAVERRKGEE